MIIHKPYIYRTDSKLRLESEIEIGQSMDKIWFEVEEAYGSFLCDDSADAFLLALLPVAAMREEDICVHANVSPKLLFHANHTHTPFLATFFEKKAIQIHADHSEVILYHGSAVMTACSLGVDSLSTIYQHISPDCLPQYRLTHLTLCNSSQLGCSEQESLEKALEEFSGRISLFADEVKLPFFTINSNITSLMVDNHLNPRMVFPYFTMGSILSVQKMLSKYLFSSSYSADHTALDRRDISHSEAIIVPLMGNENVEIVLSDSFVKRIDKTLNVSKNPLTPKYLDVCWSVQSSNLKKRNRSFIKNKKNRNCGWCGKCKRVLLTLEVLGCLSDYKEAFDMDKYYAHRKDYIIDTVAKSRHDIYCREIYDLMKSNGFHIPMYGKICRILDVYNSKIIKFWYKVFVKPKKHS